MALISRLDRATVSEISGVAGNRFTKALGVSNGVMLSMFRSEVWRKVISFSLLVSRIKRARIQDAVGCWGPAARAGIGPVVLRGGGVRMFSRSVNCYRNTRW